MAPREVDRSVRGPGGHVTVVRAMQLADFDEVTALWQRTEGIGLNESDAEEATRRYLERNPELSAVAIEDGRIVGAVLCGHDGRRGYLHHLAVAREHRNAGIATRMLRHCFDRLAEAHIPKCNIFLFDDNAEGAAFWLHAGWSKRGDLRVLQKMVVAPLR